MLDNCACHINCSNWESEECIEDHQDGKDVDKDLLLLLEGGQLGFLTVDQFQGGSDDVIFVGMLGNVVHNLFLNL